MNVCVYMHIYMYTYIYTHICVYIYTHTLTLREKVNYVCALHICVNAVHIAGHGCPCLKGKREKGDYNFSSL